MAANRGGALAPPTPAWTVRESGAGFKRDPQSWENGNGKEHMWFGGGRGNGRPRVCAWATT